MTTKAGDVDLSIPKLRKGSFFPSVLERRPRIDQALHAVVMEAYASGVSTRSVDVLVVRSGWNVRHLEARGQLHLCWPRSVPHPVTDHIEFQRGLSFNSGISQDAAQYIVL